MSDLILGVGNRKSARQIISAIEKELRRTQGVPRKIVATARGIEMIAERTTFDTEFDSLTLRFRKANAQVLESIRSVTRGHDDICSVFEEEGFQVLRVSAAEGSSNGLALDLADKLVTSLALPEVWHIRGDEYRVDHISTETLFQAMVQYKASDVHLSPGEAPMFRVDGEARRSELFGALSAPQLTALIREIASDQYWDEFRDRKQTSFTFHQVGLGYARVSAFIKNGSPHVTFRFLPEVVPSFEALNVPEKTLVDLAKLHHGLVLITGMTGSGKSTTVAAMVDWINTNKAVHIITIENPVEYVHKNKKAFISQRTLGIDVLSFNDAVTGALRHDPDVIVIGEMRDPDTIRAAINAAATGHLVISTLHANTAYEVVNRIVSFFDPIERDLVKLQLRDCIRCIMCQRLMPRIGGGRLPAIEILLNDIKAIGDNILTGDSDAIRIGMQQNTSHSIIFEEYIFKALKDGKITSETAHDFVTDVSILDQMLMGTYTVPRLDSIKHLGHV